MDTAIDCIAMNCNTDIVECKYFFYMLDSIFVLSVSTVCINKSVSSQAISICENFLSRASIRSGEQLVLLALFILLGPERRVEVRVEHEVFSQVRDR